MYDITNYNSFLNAKKWILELRDRSTHEITIFVIGNKIDICEAPNSFRESFNQNKTSMLESRAVSEKEGRDFAKNNKVTYLETSGLRGNNVHEAFQTLIESKDNIRIYSNRNL